MKKILFLLVALTCSMNMSAQFMKIMKDGQFVAAYKVGQADRVVMEEEIVEKWISRGVGKWTDGLRYIFGEDPVVLDVDIYESDMYPGKYMMKGLALQEASWFYDQDMTAYEGQYWVDSEIIIDATNPDDVIVPETLYGIYSSKYDWITIGNYKDGKKFYPNQFCTLKDGVITFPARAMLIGMGTDYYYSPEFKLVLPTESANTRKATIAKHEAPVKASKPATPIQTTKVLKANLEVKSAAPSIHAGQSLNLNK